MRRSKIIKKSSPSLTSPFQFLIIACAFLECLPLSHRTCERSEESREIIMVDRGGRKRKGRRERMIQAYREEWRVAGIKREISRAGIGRGWLHENPILLEWYLRSLSATWSWIREIRFKMIAKLAQNGSAPWKCAVIAHIRVNRLLPARVSSSIRSASNSPWFNFTTRFIPTVRRWNTVRLFFPSNIRIVLVLYKC